MAELLIDYQQRGTQKEWYRHRAETAHSYVRCWARQTRSEPKPVAKVFPRRRGYDWARVQLCRSGAVRLRGSFCEAEFETLVQQWKAETQFTSFANQKFLASSYQRIIGLGPTAIPRILRELRDRPDHWFWALAALTGQNPVPPQSAGNFAATRAAWLDWGNDQGYL